MSQTYMIATAADAASLSLAITASLGAGYTLYGDTFLSGSMLCQPMILQNAGFQTYFVNQERLSKNFRNNVTASNMYTTSSAYL